jgi:hypothetical protein
MDAEAGLRPGTGTVADLTMAFFVSL